MLELNVKLDFRYGLIVIEERMNKRVMRYWKNVFFDKMVVIIIMIFYDIFFYVLN